ncbi:MAG TPA: hypothetical protein VGX68_16305 [Thermoanaerobaculia bacterium]|jgi:hypothetical protein|nr:hypothetical protein [Thermoanaerobaculia bacterium]
MRTLAVLFLSLLLSSPLLAQDGQPFPRDCTLPFEDIAMEHDLDQDCGIEGKTTSAANALQNRAKNNFCAEGEPARVSRRSFERLQDASDEAGFTSGQPPEDRSGLQNLYTTSDGITIGEGSLVRFVAFIIDAHHSNVKKGESVNCKRGGRENNDIHIVLAQSKSVSDFCTSITAEMSPHFRPEDWDSGVLEDLNRPVRLTGNLFFDGSHVPCRPGRRASPARASVWEIHPVYQVDVCINTSLSGCPFDDDSKWVPLHEFQTEEEIQHEAMEADEG